MREWQTENQSKLTEISTKWAQCINILKRIKFEGKQGVILSIKITSNITGKEFILDILNKKLEYTIHQLQQIMDSEYIYLLRDNQFQDLSDKLTALQGSVKILHTSCENLKKRDKNTECSIDTTVNLSYQLNGGTTVIDLTNDTSQISNNTEILLDVYSSIAFIINGEISPNFTLYNKAWEELSSQLSYKLDEAEEEYQTIKGEFTDISIMYQSVKNAKKYSDLVVTNKEIIETDTAGVGKFTQEYNELRGKVNTINSEFSKWDEIKIKMGEVMKKLEEHEKKATDILDLSTATRLSENFKIREEKINNELKVAKKQHSVVLSSFIAYTLLIFGVFALFEIRFDVSALQIESILLKITLVLPFLLLVGFTNRRYKELFKLKEHYAYKDSIATSIPGFKDQSGDYGDLVVTTLFSKLTSNPANDIGKKNDKSDYIDEPEALYKSAIDAIKKKITNKEELSYKIAIDAIEKEIASKRKSSYKEIFEAIEKEIAIIEGLADKNDTSGQAAFDAIKKVIADTKATDAQENN